MGADKSLNELRLEAKIEAMKIERNFWVEQGKMLQNQLQTWQKMYADLYDQLGRGVVTDSTLKENLAMASDALREPLTSVAAIEALVSSQKPDTQGSYTNKGGRNEPRLEDKAASHDSWRVRDSRAN